MRLTQTLRDHIIRAVLEDVPKVDFQAQAEALVLAEVEATMLPKIKAIYKDKALRDYLATEYVHFTGPLCGRYYRGVVHGFKLTPESKESLEELSKALKIQSQNRTQLRDKVSAMIAGCKTVKQVRDLVPEFAKYLPDENKAQLDNLPAVAGVVTSLMEAGWPKGEEK